MPGPTAVLVYGWLGFERILLWEYFAGVPALYEAMGIRTRVPRLSWGGSTEVRSAQLAEQLESEPGPLHLIAHSMGGIDARRPLPQFAARTLRDRLAERPRAEGRPVLLWADTFTNHFTPDVGLAAVRVLEGAGYSVRVVDEGEDPRRRLGVALGQRAEGEAQGEQPLDAAVVEVLRQAVPLVAKGQGALGRHQLGGVADQAPAHPPRGLAHHRQLGGPPGLDHLRVVAAGHRPELAEEALERAGEAHPVVELDAPCARERYLALGNGRGGCSRASSRATPPARPGTRPRHQYDAYRAGTAFLPCLP